MSITILEKSRTSSYLSVSIGNPFPNLHEDDSIPLFSSLFPQGDFANNDNDNEVLQFVLRHGFHGNFRQGGQPCQLLQDALVARSSGSVPPSRSWLSPVEVGNEQKSHGFVRLFVVFNGFSNWCEGFFVWNKNTGVRIVWDHFSM